MPLPRVARSCLLAFLASCGPERAASPFLAAGVEMNALAMHACGPTDGSAVAIVLDDAPIESAMPPAPFLRVAIWRPVEEIAGRTWSLEDGPEEGAAWFYASPDEFELPTAGRVRITSVDASQTIEGSVDVTFAKAGRITTTFRATWLPGRTLCG